jgi:hypothetical protein
MTAAFAGANAAAIQRLLARRTVRITYLRGRDLFSVDVVEAHNVVEPITCIAVGQRFDAEQAEALAEREAARAARIRRLDISRLDVD